jgi:DNA repair protein SbcD/Mre11
VRIVHTADWHLCDRLGRIDRTDDLHKRVERVAQICQEREADVLLIAGDIFSKQASVEDMTRSLKRVRELFAPFFARGGTILALTGNHDHDGRINMVHTGMTLAVPDAGRDGHLNGGRMYLINGRAFASLANVNGDRVQFVFVPYPFAGRYELTAADYRTKEEENRLLHGRVAEWLQGLPQKAGFKTQLPTVLAAHLYVRGSEVHTLYHLKEHEDILFDLADLNPNWAYAALGHIHKPQMIQGQANVRYCGSLDRLDFGETHDDHGVLIVDVGKTGLTKEPEHVPISATRFHKVMISNPETELSTLPERYPDRETAIVSVAVEPSSAVSSRDEIVRHVRSVFPRLYKLEFLETAHENHTQHCEFTPQADFKSTVREFLVKKMNENSDKDKDDVLSLAEVFLRLEEVS